MRSRTRHRAVTTSSTSAPSEAAHGDPVEIGPYRVQPFELVKLRPMNQRISESVNQPTNKPTNKQTNQRTNESIE